MTEITNDQLTAVSISILVEDEPGFTVRIDGDGTVERMGYSAIDNTVDTSVTGDDPALFERFVAGLPSDVVDHSGVQAAPGTEGVRIVCRIDLEAGDRTLPYEYAYSSGAGSLPRYLQLMVDLAEELTDEWYGSNLTLTAIDLAPMPATPKPVVPPTVYEPPPVAAAPPAEPAYEPPPQPSYEPPPELPPAPPYEPPPGSEDDGSADEAAASDDESATGAEEGAVEKAKPKRPPPRSRRMRPKASPKRFALAVVLDLMVLVAAYQLAVLVLPGGGLPIGAALFFLVLTEFCLLQFLRRSPGYWLLGMSAGIGEFPSVDPDQLARESLVTHIVATVMLRSGLDGLVAWADFQAPIPYFGLERVGWFSVLVSLIIGAAFLASGILIFRNDTRGVWAGAGGTAFSFLSLWLARGREFNGWLRLELMAQREAQGRPILDPTELDGVIGMVMPLALVFVLLYALGLYFTWKRLESDDPSPVASATGAAKA